MDIWRTLILFRFECPFFEKKKKKNPKYFFKEIFFITFCFFWHFSTNHDTEHFKNENVVPYETRPPTQPPPA